MTNGDRIRQMTDKELAIFMDSFVCAALFAVDCDDADLDEFGFCKGCRSNIGCEDLIGEFDYFIKMTLGYLKKEIE